MLTYIKNSNTYPIGCINLGDMTDKVKIWLATLATLVVISVVWKLRSRDIVAIVDLLDDGKLAERTK